MSENIVTRKKPGSMLPGERSGPEAGRIRSDEGITLPDHYPIG
ncbi:hypothetical protein [Prosthecochloris sp.]|nr:hypothetical protein [Prosthecochloris sp.]